jgi:hypothetical protein
MAISESVTCSDNEAVILPFIDASAVLGNSGGGMSNDDLVNFGILDTWTSEVQKKSGQLGTLGGHGTQYPTFNKINGFTYTLSQATSFNRISIVAKVSDVPRIIVNGVQGTYINHTTVSDYFLLNYRLPKTVQADVINFVIIGADSVGGGVQKFNTETVEFTETLAEQYYPYVQVKLIENVEQVGIQTQTYQVRAFNTENKIVEFALPTEVSNNFNTTSPDFSLVFDKGSITLDGAVVTIGFTMYIYNNSSEALQVLNDFVSMSNSIMYGTATAKAIRIR